MGLTAGGATTGVSRNTEKKGHAFFFFFFYKLQIFCFVIKKYCTSFVVEDLY